MKALKQTLAGAGSYCAIALGVVCAGVVANAQPFTTIKSFGILSNATGLRPQSQLVQGPDGTLYGTTSEGDLFVRGSIFKVQPDGSGFTVLKLFTYSGAGFVEGGEDIEGADPTRTLALSDNVLYGTTRFGGNWNGGTVFALNTDGTGFRVLKHFVMTFGSEANSEGAFPTAVVAFGSVLYGTTTGGGSAGKGTVFQVNTDGTAYTVLKHFTGAPSDGAGPWPGLTLSGSVLFGTTSHGGSSNQGTVFKLNTDGTGYTVLKQFTGNDGAEPQGLTSSGSLLYGTMRAGGNANNGTVFKLKTDGTGFSVLKHHSQPNFDPATGSRTNNDGAYPTAVVASGSLLYGTTTEGGSAGRGTVFQMNTNGTGYTVLKSFTGGLISGSNTNYEGMFPAAGLTLSGGVLYGTTGSGGNSFQGTVFRLNLNGTDYTVLKHFTYSDGLVPEAGLTSSGSVLYGTTQQGGSWNWGTIFRINTDGTGYTVLKEFTDGDGAGPHAGLTVSSNVLYGTTQDGGDSWSGTVFKLNTDGSGYTVIRKFQGFSQSDGANPRAGLTLSGNVLYGTTTAGGSWDHGIVFKVDTDGTGYTVLKSFTGPPDEGKFPTGSLALTGNVLYGTTIHGGSLGLGTVFKLNTDGTGYTVLKHFPGFTSGDGQHPRGGLTLSGGRLYGTTQQLGGSWAGGTVFRMNTDGTGYTVLKSFTGSPNDGAIPQADLTLSGNVLFGTTFEGGSSGFGTVFKLNTDGTGYMVLHHFTDSGESAVQCGGLTLSGSVLYGATRVGGSFGAGSVFKLDLSSVLFTHALGNDLVLSWIDPGFNLQAAPNLTGTYTNIPGATSPHTNPITGSMKFFRLIGN